MVTIPKLSNGQKASCPRCSFILTRYFSHARSKLFALSTTALTFMLLTLFFPFLIFNAQGSERTVFYVESIQSLGQGTYIFVVVFLLATTLLIPAILLLGINYVLISSKFKIALPYTREVLRTVFYLRPWNMAEIFLLGILVSMVKIASLAEVSFGSSFFAFVLYILSMAASRFYLDRLQVWKWIGHHKIEQLGS